MPSVTVNGQTYQDFTAAFPGGQGFPDAGIYYALPPFGQPPSFGLMSQEIQKIPFVGINGQGRKIFGDRSRPIWMDFIVIGTPGGTLRSNMAALFTTLNGSINRYTVALPGQSFNGCVYADIGKPVFENWLTNCQFTIPILLEQLSTAN